MSRVTELIKPSTSTTSVHMYKTKGDVCMCTKNQLEHKLQNVYEAHYS